MNSNTTEDCLKSLRQLCHRSGFVQVLAFYCLRSVGVNFCNGYIKSKDEFRPPTRREFSLLVHLCFEMIPDCRPLTAIELQGMLDEADNLLEELHCAVNRQILSTMRCDHEEAAASYLSLESGIPEVLFYGTDTEYSYQFVELAALKYREDSEWFRSYKGFSFEEMLAVIATISNKWHRRVLGLSKHLVSAGMDAQLDLVKTLTFEIEDIQQGGNLPQGLILKVVQSFAISGPLKTMLFWNENTEASICPFLKTEKGFILFHPNFLLRALYFNPTYWIRDADKAYAQNILPGHRKAYTESFVFDRMRMIFGDRDVLRDVKIRKRNGDDVTDVDVLVIWRSFALIIQIKAKTITKPALQGEMSKIQDDFQKAVYSAYEQGIECYNAISKPAEYKFFLNDNKEIAIKDSPRKVYVVCVAGDGYPAVHLQSRFIINIRFDDPEHRPYPLVFDNFSFDTATRVLEQPFQFINYLNTLYNMERKDLLLYESPNAVLGAFLESNLIPVQQMIVTGKMTGAFLDENNSKVIDDAADLYAQGRTEKLEVDSESSRVMQTWIGRHIFGSFNSSTDRRTLMIYFTLAQIPAHLLSQFDIKCEQALGAAKLSEKIHNVRIVVGRNDTVIELLFVKKYDSDICSDVLQKSFEKDIGEAYCKLWVGIVIDVEKIYPVASCAVWDAKAGM